MKNIRYTQGPDQVELGGVVFKRGEAQEIGEELAVQALLPQRVAEYGFEAAYPPDAETEKIIPASLRRAPKAETKTEPTETNQE